MGKPAVTVEHRFRTMRRHRQLKAVQSTSSQPVVVVRTMSDIETVPIIEHTLSQAETSGQTARSKKNWVLARAGVKRLIQASRELGTTVAVAAALMSARQPDPQAIAAARMVRARRAHPKSQQLLDAMQDNETMGCYLGAVGTLSVPSEDQARRAETPVFASRFALRNMLAAAADNADDDEDLDLDDELFDIHGTVHGVIDGFPKVMDEEYD